MSTDPAAREIPADRCPAHGKERCARCGLIAAGDLTDDGESCRGCDYWGSTGMHWDTCPHRIRGDIVIHPKLRRRAAVERLGISGRDPDSLTPIEILAFAYPDVFALVKQDTKIAEMWRSVRMVDKATGSPFRSNWPGLAAELDRLVDPDPPEPQ